jgi:hypothetical protein
MFSNNTLYASISHYGIGTFTSKDLKPNEAVMEIPANYTISCFDNYFPYMEMVNKIAEQYKEEASIDEINFMKLILNFNYLRLVDRTNRFFRIFFDNLPNYMEYFPFWPDEEKNIIKKLMADPTLASDLFLHNNTVLDYMLEDVKRLVRRADPNIAALVFNDNKVNEAINLIYSRGYIFSLKGWKVIHSKQDEIETSDIENIGYIIIPGADGINHESKPTTHPDVSRSNLSFQKGVVVVKAGRSFKLGEEFLINYDRFIGVHEIFKKYGFVPLDSINHNQLYRYEYVNMTTSSFEVKQLCMALNACHGRHPSENLFSIPKWTNSINEAHLNLDRIRYWIGPPINEYKIIDIFNQITNRKHSNITEGIVLSKFIHNFYGLLIYSVNFRVGIDNLLRMYELNEKHVDLREIFKVTNLKLTISDHPPTIHQRFRELLKFALLNQHMVSVNLQTAEEYMENTLDSLWFETKKEIVENVE